MNCRDCQRNDIRLLSAENDLRGAAKGLAATTSAKGRSLSLTKLEQAKADIASVKARIEDHLTECEVVA